MSYNLKCCSFYPNNFDASALCCVREFNGLFAVFCHLIANFAFHTAIERKRRRDNK